MRKNIIYIAITAAIMLTTIIFAVSGFNTPKEIIKTGTLLSYNLQGNFSHQAYGYARTDSEICVSCGQLSDLVYFPKIIEDITCDYTYEFLTEEEVSDIKTQVQISAILTSTYWSKGITIVPTQEMTDKSVSFPLDTDGYRELVNKISQELGLGTSSTINVLMTAYVQTEATIENEIITENFVQSCEVSIGSTTIQWVKPLDLSLKGYQAGIEYEQRGRFGYTIDLLPNTLFGDVTLSSPSQEIKVLRKLDQAVSYKSDVIDSMNVNFAYNLVADEDVTGITNTVKASAVLSNIDGTHLILPLLDEEEYTNDFTLRLPIDFALVYDYIKKIENTTANDFSNTYNLQLKIDIHTTTMEPGVIDESVSAVLPIILTANDLTVEVATGSNKTGTLTETVMVSNSKRSTLMMTSLSLLFLTILAGLWAGWNFWESRRKYSLIHQIWEAARQIMDKHKDIFINVLDIPPAAENERTTQLESLGELVKLSDSLLKPVLHQKDEDRHVFYVIDGTSRYVYMVIEPPPA